MVWRIGSDNPGAKGCGAEAVNRPCSNAWCCDVQVLEVVIDVQNKTGKLYKDWLKYDPCTQPVPCKCLPQPAHMRRLEPLKRRFFMKKLTAVVPVCIRAIEVDPRLPEIKKKVEAFAQSFPMPGFAVGQNADSQVRKRRP